MLKCICALRNNLDIPWLCSAVTWIYDSCPPPRYLKVTLNKTQQLASTTVWFDIALSLPIHSFVHSTNIYQASTMWQALCFEFFQWFSGYTQNINSPYTYNFLLALLSNGIFRLQKVYETNQAMICLTWPSIWGDST